MKKKFLVLFIIAILTVSMISCAFALTLSDVKGTKCEEAVGYLTDLKVINGYEDNTFRPNRTITRAEMSKIIIVALGKQSSVKTTVTTRTFSDVAPSHWAAGYIELASSLDIIKGYPGGTFMPENPVSYVEAATMMLRALNYNKEMETYSWPDGYIKKASDIKLLTGVTYKTPNDSALRGDIANMTWNTLNAYCQKIVSENSNGVVYGNDKLLIEKSFPNSYLSVEDAVIVDIDIDDNTITVDIDGKEKDLEYADATDTELMKLYGRTIEKALYDSKNKDFLVLELDDGEKSVSGTVKKFTDDDEVYIGSTAYDIPASSKIKLVGISDMEDADKVYIVMYGSKVRYMLFQGEEELYVGLVSDYTAATSKKLASVEMYTLEEDDFEEFDVASTTKLSAGDVVIYALNSDDEVVVRKVVDIDDSKAITLFTKASSSSATAYVQLKGESKVSLSKSVDYVAVKADIDGEELTEINLTKSTAMDEDADTAVFVTVNDTKYLIVFVDGLDYEEDDDDDDDEMGTVKEELAKLKPYFNTSTNKIYKAYRNETSYTATTYSAFEDAYDSAKELYDQYKNSTSTSSTVAKKLYTARTTLESKYSKLKTATATDKQVSTLQSNLKTKISDAEELYEDTRYTQETRNALNSAITTAKKYTTSTTVATLQGQIDKLDSAIAALRTDDSQPTVAKIKQEFKDELARAKAIVDKKTDYKNYENLEKDYKVCAKFNVDSTSTTDLESWTETLKADIESVETKEYNALKTAISSAKTKNKTLNSTELEDAIETAEDILDDADPLTFKDTEAAKDLNDAVKAAESENALEEEEYKLRGLIGMANELGSSSEELGSAIRKAEQAIDNSNKTVDSLKSAYSELKNAYDTAKAEMEEV